MLVRLIKDLKAKMELTLIDYFFFIAILLISLISIFIF